MARTHNTPPTASHAPAKQICRERGIPYTTLRDVVLRGEIPVLRIGRAWYLARRDVDAWIASHTERFAS